ncbi:MAG TPA: transglutaminaseTgpA domain-containing protein [Stenomitos sp.]
MAFSLRLLNPADPLLNLRLASAASLGIGVLALFSINQAPWCLLALVICWAGCWFSHRMQGRSSRLVKSFLAVGMLYLLWQYLANLVSNLQDTRLPLAELLLWLQVLNAWDLPRRHNLRIAQMVGAILLIATATLSREMTFGLFVLAYALTALWWGHEDMLSELGAKVSIRQPASRNHLLRAFAGMLALGGGLFLFVPRLEGGYLKQLPVSMMMTLPSNLSPKIVNSAYPMGQGSGPGSGRRVNPQAYYGFAEELDLNYRGRLSDEIALKVRSPRRQYWRGMAYDRYDGRTWQMQTPDEVATLSIATLPFMLGTDPLDSGVTGVVTVYVEKDQTNLVLLPERPRRLYFPSSILFTDLNGGVRSPVTLDQGMYYTTVMDMAGYRRNWLKDAPHLSRAQRQLLSPYLQTPTLTPRTRALARKVVGTASSSFEAVRRLEDYLKEHYRYDLGVPPFPAGVETVDYFLFEQPDHAAYCEQFATALAVMARSVGVPTRLVTGYLPGTYNPFTGLYEVKTSEAHAWVEAFFPGEGWVPFDPTPGSSDPMGVSQEAARLPIRELLGRVRGGLGVLLAIAVATSVLLGLLGVFGRFRFGQGAQEVPPTVAYRRYLALLSRHGLGLPQAGDTPGMHLERLKARPGFEAIATDAERFVRSYESERFGGQSGEEPLEQQLEAIAQRLKARRNA